MKVLSVQQPWASVICTGVKDVENRTWQPKEVPGRILIHASAKRVPKNFDDTNPCLDVVSAMMNMRIFGILPQYNELPISAIIGYVDVVGFEKKEESIWAGSDSIHWNLANAYLFDKPIEDVKGKLGLFDYPIDENNLPPAHKVELNYPTIEGEHLTVHLSDDYMAVLLDGDESFAIDIFDPMVMETICKKDSIEMKPVKKITFINGNLKEKREVIDYGWDAYKDQDGNDIIFNPDDKEEDQVPWMYAVYRLK